jgi:hypothetical protein
MLAEVGLTLGIMVGSIIVGWAVLACLIWGLAWWTGRQKRAREETPREKGTSS